MTITAGGKISLIAAGAAVLAVAAIFFFLPAQNDVTPARADAMAHPLPEQPSIAMLPFGGKIAHAIKGDIGINVGESIAGVFSRLPQLFAIGTQASAFLGEIAPGKAAEALAVRHILHGRVAEGAEKGDDPVLTVTLVDAVEGKYLWRDQIEIDDQDHLELRDEIVAAVLEGMEIQIPEEVLARASRPGIKDRKVTAFLRESRERWFEFEAAVNNRLIADAKTWSKKKPSNAALRVQLAWGYWAKLARGWTYGQSGGYKRMADAAAAALSIDPDYPPAHGVRAVVKIWGGDVGGAFKACDRAIALAPSDAGVAFDCGLVYLLAGRSDDALAQTRRGFRLYPQPPLFRYDALAEIHRVRGESGEMRKIDEMIIAQAGKPHLSVPAHLRLLVAEAEAGDMAAARKHLARAEEAAPDFPNELHRRLYRYRDKAIMDKFQTSLEAVRKAATAP